MDEVKKWVLEIFRELPEWAKLAAFVILFIIAVGLTVRDVLKFWELRELKKDLKTVTEERDQLLARFESLKKVDSLVWTRPAGLEKNRFIPKADRRARFVAFCNFKGGVGKTTLTLNLGVALALKGKRVLLVDLDWQGTLSNLALAKKQLKENREKGLTTERLFRDVLSPLETKELMFSLEGAPTCQLMMAREKLEEVEFQQQSRFFVNADVEVRFLLQQALHTPEISANFDYVFFDCPPRLTTACINALTCADYVLVPTSLSEADIQAVPRTLDQLKDLNAVVQAQFLGVVITRGRLRNGELVSYEKPQLGALKKLISGIVPGQGFVFSAIITG